MRWRLSAVVLSVTGLGYMVHRLVDWHVVELGEPSMPDADESCEGHPLT